MKNQRILDNAGNYLCTIGMAGEKIYFSLIPFAVSVIVLILFHSLWGSSVSFVFDKLADVGLKRDMLDQGEFVIQCINYAWIVSALIVFWQRERGAVDFMQNAFMYTYYLLVAFAAVGKLVADLLNHNIEKGALQIAIYVAGFIGYFVIVCVVGVIATILCAPQAIALALMVGIPLDLGLIYFRSQKIAETQCWKATLDTLQDVDLENEVFEVQLTESGVYFVNPDNRVMNCVSFASHDYPNLDYWTRKIYIAMLMQKLPKGYYVESLNEMFVAENISLKTKLHRDETIRRKSAQQENKRRRSEGKTW